MRAFYRNNNKGFALVFTILFLFVVIASVNTFLLATLSGFTVGQRTADLKRAYYVADAGLTNAYIQLSNSSNPAASFTVTNNSYAVGGGRTGSYSVSLNKPSGSLIYTIISTGTYRGLSKTLTLRVQQSAISAFAYLSNTEIHPTLGRLWWITGMTTIGPVRTNGQLNIWGNPMFQGAVTQSNSALYYWYGPKPANTQDNPTFNGGLNLSSPSIVWPTTGLMSSISSAASAGGLALVGNSTIRFNSDGTMNVTNVARGWTNQNMPLPSNGVIHVAGGSPTVQGTIRGQVTLGSASQIFISGNLVYNTNPRTTPSSTDLLALVSQNNVTVTAASAPAQLELDAVMVAINGAFQVDQYWVTGKGDMVQYGSLINNYCGPTGIFDPGTGVLHGGYNQLQYYDTRLQTLVPPAFPPAVDSNGRVTYVKLSFTES